MRHTIIAAIVSLGIAHHAGPEIPPVNPGESLRTYTERLEASGHTVGRVIGEYSDTVPRGVGNGGPWQDGSVIRLAQLTGGEPAEKSLSEQVADLEASVAVKDARIAELESKLEQIREIAG